MQRLTIIIFFCLASMMPTFAQSGFPSPDSTTPVPLETFIREALEKNPIIHSAEQQYNAVLSRVPQVRSLDDPILSYTHWFSSVETRVGPMQNSLRLSQRFPFFGKLRLRGKMAEQDGEVAGQHHHAIRRDVIFRVKITYFDLYRIDRSIAILREYRELLKRFQKVAARKYATGIGTRVNVLKAQVEIAALQEQIINFTQIREGAVARLNALLGRDETHSIAQITEIDTSLLALTEAEILEAAFAAREELQSAEAQIRKAQFAIRLAKRNFFPDVTLALSYTTIPSGRTPAIDRGKDPWALQVGINLPIYRGKRKAAVEEARALRNSQQLYYRNLRNEVVAEIRELHARLKASEQTMVLYQRQLLPDARQTLQSALSAYQTGSLDFLSLLDSERMLLQFRLAYVEELSDYRQIAAALQRAMGRDLP